MKLEAILTSTCCITSFLDFEIWNSNMNLLFSSYWCRIPTFVWCSYSSCHMVNVFEWTFCCDKQKKTSIWTILTLYFDYAQKFSIVMPTRYWLTYQNRANSFHVSNAFQTSAYIKERPWNIFFRKSFYIFLHVSFFKFLLM